MGWLIALGVITALALLPLGISARYDDSGALVCLIAGPVRVKLYPRKKKDKTPQKEKEPEKKAAQKPAQEKKQDSKAGGSWKNFVPLIRVALDFLGDFRRKLRINRLEMKIVLASDDPADLAINYGRAWAALGNLWPRLETLFVIKKRDVQVECDFTADETLVFARGDLTITLVRMVSLVARYGIRALKEFMKLRNQNKGGATK